MAGEINFGQLQGLNYADMLQSFSGGQQVADRRTQNALQAAQLARQTAADARAEKERQGVAAAVGPDGTIDAGKAKLAYAQAGDLTGALAIDDHIRTAKKAQLDAALAQNAATVQLIGTAKDQSSYDAAKAKAAELGLDVSSLPPRFDPAVVGQMQTQAMTVGEQLKAKQADADLALKVAAQGETTRHNTATEGLTARQIARQSADAAAGRAVTMRGQNMTDARMKAIQAGSALTPDDVQFYAEQVAAGDTSPLTNFGRGTQGAANVVAIRNAAANIQRGRGLTGADAAATSLAYGGQKAAARTTGNMGAKIDYGVNELAASIPLAAQASAALPRGSFVPLNKVKQMIAAGNGDPALKDFAVKSQAALNAYNMVAARGGSSVGEREHNATLLMTADSPAAYQAALNAMAQEGAVAKGASHQTMNDVTGRRTPRTTEHAGGTLTRAGGGVLEWKPNGGR